MISGSHSGPGITLSLWFQVYIVVTLTIAGQCANSKIGKCVSVIAKAAIDGVVTRFLTHRFVLGTVGRRRRVLGSV